MLEGNAARLKHEHNHRAWLAWHTANMTGVKKMPRLKTLLILDQPKQQSIDQMRATARAWVAAFSRKDR